MPPTADVTFESAEWAQWAIETHNGVTAVRGHTLSLRPSATDPCVVVAGNLPADIDGDELAVLYEEPEEDMVEVEDDADEEEDAAVTEPPKKKAKKARAESKMAAAAGAASSEGAAGGQTFEVRYMDASQTQAAAKKLNGSWWDDTTQARVRLSDCGSKLFLRVAAAGVRWQDVKTFCATAGTVIFTGEKGKGKGDAKSNKGVGKAQEAKAKAWARREGTGKGEAKSKSKKGGKTLPADSDSSSDEGGKGKSKSKDKSKSKGAGKVKDKSKAQKGGKESSKDMSSKGKSKSKGRSGRFKVRFVNEKHAKKAVKKLNGAWWDDFTQAKVMEDWEGDRVNVEILAASVTPSNLKAWFAEIGPVRLVSPELGSETPKGKGKSSGEW